MGFIQVLIHGNPIWVNVANINYVSHCLEYGVPADNKAAIVMLGHNEDPIFVDQDPKSVIELIRKELRVYA